MWSIQASYYRLNSRHNCNDSDACYVRALDVPPIVLETPAELKDVANPKVFGATWERVSEQITPKDIVVGYGQIGGKMIDKVPLWGARFVVKGHEQTQDKEIVRLLPEHLAAKLWRDINANPTADPAELGVKKDSCLRSYKPWNGNKKNFPTTINNLKSEKK